eukprot:SAG22_NODE_806_length_7087_cov_11.682885_5_plen_71_part_01
MNYPASGCKSVWTELLKFRDRASIIIKLGLVRKAGTMAASGGAAATLPSGEAAAAATAAAADDDDDAANDD